VYGHGKQQLIFPWNVGTGAQNRPGMTTFRQPNFNNPKFSFSDIHPPAPGNFDSCRKGAGHAPRSVVTFAIAIELNLDLDLRCVPSYID